MTVADSLSQVSSSITSSSWLEGLYLNASGVGVYLALGIAVIVSLLVVIYKHSNLRKHRHGYRRLVAADPPASPTTSSVSINTPNVSFTPNTRYSRERFAQVTSATPGRAPPPMSLSTHFTLATETPEEQEMFKIQVSWHIVALLFVIARTGMMAMRLLAYWIPPFGRSVGTMVLRTGGAFHFTMYSLVVYWWAALYSRAMRMPKMKPYARTLLVLLNCFTYFITIVSTGLYLAFGVPDSSLIDEENDDWNSSGDKAQNVLLQLSIWPVLILVVLLEVFVPIYAAVVFRAQKNEVWFLRAERKDIVTVFCYSIVFLFCGALRTLTIITEMAFGVFIHEWFLYLIGYFIPESIDVVLEIYTLHSHLASAAAAVGGNDSNLIRQLFESAHSIPYFPELPPESPQQQQPLLTPKQNQAKPQQEESPETPVSSSIVSTPLKSVQVPAKASTSQRKTPAHSLYYIEPQRKSGERSVPKRREKHAGSNATTPSSVSTTSIATSIARNMTPSRGPPQGDLINTTPVRVGNGEDGPASVALSPSSAAVIASTKRQQLRSVYGENVADRAARGLFDVDAPPLPVQPLVGPNRSPQQQQLSQPNAPVSPSRSLTPTHAKSSVFY